MSMSDQIHDAAALRDRAARAVKVQLGLANPLWLAFGAAASAGAAWWLMTRWAFPLNIEAMAEPTRLDGPEPSSEVVVPALAAPEDSVETTVPANDDLTRLVGVGPRTAEALKDHGVQTFAQLAAWTDEDLAAFDAALNLKGRGLRDKWLDQARDLAVQA